MSFGPKSLINLGRIAVLLLCVAVNQVGAEGLLRPAGLEPEIAFWRSIFAEISTSQAAIHDARHLSVVYEIVDLPPQASAAARKRVAKAARKRYEKILAVLASGRRSGLTSEQRRVLQLWPDDVSNAELRRATKRIRFQNGMSDRYRAGLERSGQWRDYIRAQLDEHGVPAGLAALPHVESSFNPTARSHVGAAGMWQFTRGTGRRFMQVDHVVDGRRDPFMSSEAAAKLLAYNYSIVKVWPLAITGYNHGIAGMRRAVRTLGTTDIETIVRHYKGRAFGFASRNFYVAFLAALEVERDAERYFGEVTRLAPRPDLLVVTPAYIPAAELATAFGITTEILKAYNPALMPTVWSGAKHVPRGFPLRLPINNGRDTSPLRLASIPERARYAEQTRDVSHRIRRGESLSVIARRYKTSVAELMAMNGLRSRHRIRAGQTLRLPLSDTTARPAVQADAETYRVRSGDTLGGIAQRAGVSQSSLLALNNLSNRNRIYPGQLLRLRRAEAVVAPANSPAAGDSAVVSSAPSASSAASTAHADAGSTPPAAVLATAEASAPPPPAAKDSGSATSLIVPPASSAAATSMAELADDAAPVVPVTDEADALLADPSDYLVAADGSVEVQAAETLGHYADWLELPTQRLREKNGYSFRQPVVIGRRVKLDLSKVSAEDFAARRIAYHRELQGMFFSQYRVTETTVHKLRRGESVWLLALQRYKVPVWLLRQYNPDLDLDRVRPGMPLVFPQVEELETVRHGTDTLADAS